MRKLSNEEILGLTSKKRKPRSDYSRVNTDSDSRGFDVMKVIQPGYPQPGDKGDIWTQWVKQGRKGAKELIERWG